MDRRILAVLLLFVAGHACQGWNVPVVGGLFGSNGTTIAENTTSTTETPLTTKRAWGFGIGNIASSMVNKTKGIVSGVGNVASNALDKTMDLAGSTVDMMFKITETAINKGVGFFLDQFNSIVKTMKVDVLPIPSLSVSPFYIASFQAGNGFFKSLSSLTKDGDITIRRNGTSVEIYVPMKFDEMAIGYKNYSMTVFGYGVEGNVSVGVKTNKLSMRLKLNLSTKCAISLEDIKFFEMEGIEVNLTGLCYYCGVVSSNIASYLTQTVHDTIRNLIRDKVDSLMKTVLNENSMICTKFVP